MSNETREFELGAVITATTGRMVARDGFGAVHKLFEYISGGPVWTHQLPRLFDECKPGLEEQFPWMCDIVFPDNIHGTNWEQWLDEQVTIHGATLRVKPIDPSQYYVINPIQEAVDMMGLESVIVIAVN